MNTSADNYDFKLVGTEERPFVGYISAEDPTRVSPRAMVRGSQNVLLLNSGNVGNRPGIKRYDPADPAEDGIVASFDWTDVEGNTLLVRVLESGPLQFYRTEDQTWYTIYDFGEDTDVSFAKWWSQMSSKELLVMANGTPNLYAWPGGITNSVGEVNDSNSIFIDGGLFLTTLSFDFVPEGLLTTVTGTSSFFEGAIVFEENPAPSGIIATLASTSPPLGETIFIDFVDTLTSPVVPELAQVLIGATKEETAANLLALLQNPNVDTATQRGFGNSDVNDLIGFASYSFVPALESGNDQTWLEQGFVNYGSITVDGTTYTYDFVIGRYLVDISGTPPQGEFAYSGLAVTENATPTGEDYAIDFILCLTNQLMTFSYTNRVVYISSNQDQTSSTGYTDFVNGSDLVPGDPDFTVLDEFPKGGTTKGNSAYVGAGTSSWYEITPNIPAPIAYSTVDDVDAYVLTEVKKFAGAGLTAPLGHNFVSTVGEDIIYLSQDNQLRTLGFYRNLAQQKSPSLSLQVRKELAETDFTGGCIRTIDEFTYLVAPVPGRTFLYQIRDDVDNVGDITSIRQWQPPQDWNISRIALVDGLVHGYSAQNPQLYQLFNTDQWHDDTPVVGVFAPYTSVCRLAYDAFRFKPVKFDKVYYEGYILPNSDLVTNIYYDYRGATNLAEKVISSADGNPVLFGGSGVVLIGGDVIGNTTIGGGLRDVAYGPLEKFRAIADVQIDDCYEYQIELVSQELDSRWELLATGANVKDSTNSPVRLNLTT